MNAKDNLKQVFAYVNSKNKKKARIGKTYFPNSLSASKRKKEMKTYQD